MRDEDHKDVHPALPWSACTIRAGTRGLAVCGWAARWPIIALRKMPEALCVASLRHVVVCRVQRPPLVCSDFWNNNLTGSIPSQLSLLNQLTLMYARQRLVPVRPVAMLEHCVRYPARADGRRWCAATSATTA